MKTLIRANEDIFNEIMAKIAKYIIKEVENANPKRGEEMVKSFSSLL